MKKEPKTLVDAEKSVLDRKGEGSALKASGRVMSLSEQVFLRKLKERGIEAIEKNHLDVWFVTDERTDWTKKIEGSDELIALEDAHNEKVRSGEEVEEREYRFWQKDFGDFRYDLEQKYGKLDQITEIPELIVIQSREGEYDGAWTGVPKMVNDSVETCVKNLYRYWDEEIILHLGEELCCPIATKFDFQKVDLSEENLIEYGLTNLELTQRERQNVLFERYMLTKDDRHLTEFFSDDVLREIYEYMCTFDESEVCGFADDFWGNTSNGGSEPDNESDFFREFKVTVDHEKKRMAWQADQDKRKEKGEYIDEYDEYDWEGEEVDAATENYVKYRKSITDLSRNLSFEDSKEKMRQTYVSTLKKALDAYAPEYTREHDMFEAEKRLLRPVLVHVSKNPVQRELMRDHGADVVLESFSPDDMQELLELVGTMKSSAASLMPDKLRRIKDDFYKSVEDKLDARSEITAETEKEVEILDDIFQRTQDVRNVLDVACGNGRIDVPLLQKGYAVTGVDANEQFLQSALKKAFEGGFADAQFKKGDVIDYRGVVEPGSQDAVIYTWHAILEAFGPGNMLQTLGCAWQSLRPGGVLVFDQPTRENPHMEDGWYGDNPDSEHRYLSYIMTEEDLGLMLRMAGFEQMEIKKWKTKPSEEYPEGMYKFTISARKPDVSEDAKAATRMYREIINGERSYSDAYEQWSKDQLEWADEFSKKKSAK